MVSKTIVLILSILCLANGKQLPSFIKKCKLSDPDLGNCVFDQLEEFAKHMTEPIKELHLPTLSPFHMDRIEIQVTPTFHVKLEEIDVLNLDQAKIASHEVDLKKGTSKMVIHFDSITLLATYDIDGKIMVLPIKGNGPANITAGDFNVEYSLRFETYKKKGVDYFHLTDNKFDFTTDKIYLNFGNLFNGDKALGDQMNQFLNENAQDVLKEFYPALNTAISSIINKMFDTVANYVSVTDLFDP